MNNIGNKENGKLFIKGATGLLRGLFRGIFNISKKGCKRYGRLNPKGKLIVALLVVLMSTGTGFALTADKRAAKKEQKAIEANIRKKKLDEEKANRQAQAMSEHAQTFINEVQTNESMKLISGEQTISTTYTTSKNEDSNFIWKWIRKNTLQIDGEFTAEYRVDLSKIKLKNVKGLVKMYLSPSDFEIRLITDATTKRTVDKESRGVFGEKFTDAEYQGALDNFYSTVLDETKKDKEFLEFSKDNFVASMSTLATAFRVPVSIEYSDEVEPRNVVGNYIDDVPQEIYSGK